MTNKELYEQYIAKRAQVDTLQNQIQNLNAQLYTAENELAALRDQVQTISNDALIASLIEE